MPILTPAIRLVVFRQSLRPHSAVAFLVEFLCFVLELLDKEKDLAKIFGIVSACDTLIFTMLDIIQNLIEGGVKIRRCGQVFWLYKNDGSLYWHTLNAYLLMLSIVHVIGSAISYRSRRRYLVLLPLFVAGLELLPQEAYQILGNDQIPRDCIGPLQNPLDGIELEEGDRVPDQEVADHVAPDGANDEDLYSKVLVVLGWLGSSRKDAQDVNITGPSSMKNEEVMGPRQQVKPTALHSKTPTAKSAKCKDNASSATDKQSTNSVIKVQNRYGLLSDNES
ncbi:uncharacterized protein LOC111199036 [Brassica napus]|uniref:uncharacterized protein LOC111199036 n=1 Tax=Brassica napus TaxID=3708 RepID=UPI0004EF04F1|nr:uncharacterized protein LOC111199036 [Brassica napus]